MLASRSASRHCEREWKEGYLKKDVKVVATTWEREGNFLIRIKRRAEPANQVCGKETSQQESLFLPLFPVREELPSHFPHCIQFSGVITSLSYEWLCFSHLMMGHQHAKGHTCGLKSPHRGTTSVPESIPAHKAVSGQVPWCT